MQGHFAPFDANADIEKYYTFESYAFSDYPDGGYPNNMLKATNSEYTTISIRGNYSPDAQIDVSISAMLAYDGEFKVYPHLSDALLGLSYLTPGVVVGEISYSVQTFTIPSYQTSADSTNTTATVSSSSNTGFCVPTKKDGVISMSLAVFIVIITVFLSVITLLLALILFKIRKPRQQ